MDNLGELIFFIIFILISIINGIAKSKKKKQQQGQKPQNRTNLPDSAPRKRTGTILDDLIFDEEEKAEPGYYGEDSNSSNQRTWDPAEEFGLKTDPIPEIGQKTHAEKSYQNKYIEKMQEIEEEKKKRQNFSSDQIKLSVHQSQSVKKPNKFSKLLHDPTSLKNYILISEILGKPKALRK